MTAESPERPRLILADDHPDVLEAVVRLLRHDSDIVSTVTDGVAALDAVIALQPDLLILDISMPGLTGIEVARRLSSGGSTVRIIFLTVIEDAEFARASLAEGGSAYVVKSRLGTDLRHAIREVTAGHTFISPSLAVAD